MTDAEVSPAATSPGPSWLQADVDAIVSRHPTVGIAVGVVSQGRLAGFYGHGFANIGSKTPVTESTVFRVGSITKTFVAVAIMQLCEAGLIDLDTPADEYLRAYRLVPAKPAHRPATIRELLTHTSGLPELVHPARTLKPVLGQTVSRGKRVPSLAEFYRGRLRLVAAPGTQHAYSNHGFATLGQIIEDVTSGPLDRFLRDRIFTPLGMDDTGLTRSERIGSHLATGYTLRSRGPRPVRDQELVTAAAGGIYSTVADLATYMAALLAPAAGGDATLLRADTLADMFAPQYQPDVRMPGVGLGFFGHDLARRRVVGHDGLMPGFTSQILMAPADGVGVVALTNTASGAIAWLGAEAAAILAHALGAEGERPRVDVPQHPEIWADVCGRYSFRGSFHDVQKWFVAEAFVTVRRGRLVLKPQSPIPSARQALQLRPASPDDPYVFQIDLSKLGIRAARVVFSRSPGAGVTALHVDLGIALLSFDKRQRPRRRLGKTTPGDRSPAPPSEVPDGHSDWPRRIPIRGMSMYVDAVGDGYPLLLMHGGPGADHWTLQPFRQLADQFALIFYDHRCNGRSYGAPIESMTFENLTADADALRKRLGHEQWAVLGHSFGGHVALEYALRYPGNVSHLILLDTGGDSTWAAKMPPAFLPAGAPRRTRSARSVAGSTENSSRDRCCPC